MSIVRALRDTKSDSIVACMHEHRHHIHVRFGDRKLADFKLLVY